jgi:CRP-like cAMP-binding protein
MTGTDGHRGGTTTIDVTRPAAGSSFLDRLDPVDRERLLATGVRRRYRKGAPVFLEGDRSDHVLVIVEGRVRVSVAAADGRDLVIAVRGPGELLGELAAIDRDEPRSASAFALEALVVQVVPAVDFEAFLESSPRAAIALLRTLTRRLRETSRTQMEFGSYDTVARVARRLDELATTHGEPGDDGIVIGLPLTQEELAGWIGASRESVARAMRVLRDRGVVTTSRRRIVVHDPAALRRYGT